MSPYSSRLASRPLDLALPGCSASILHSRCFVVRAQPVAVRASCVNMMAGTAAHVATELRRFPLNVVLFDGNMVTYASRQWKVLLRKAWFTFAVMYEP